MSPRLREGLRRCLEKNPRRRWQAAGDLRAELEAILSAPSAVPSAVVAAGPSPPLWKRIAPIAAFGVIASAVTGGLVWNARPRVTPPRVARFAVTLASYQVTTRLARNSVTVSPDGTRLVYVVDRQLYLKNLDEVDGRPINGSADAQGVIGPVFSPDGESVAFYSTSEKAIRRIPVAGGSPSTICMTESPTGLAWDGDSVFFGHSKGLMRVSAAGGLPELVASFTPLDGERLFGPQLLPGGKAILFTSAAGGAWATAGKIITLSLASGARSVVVEGGAADARYVASGHILYVKGGGVYALAFDAATLKAHGAPVRVIEGVRRSDDLTGMDLSVSENGTLAYVPGPASGEDMTLAWFDCNGAVAPLPVPPGNYVEPRLSPDGTRVALGNADGADAAVWIADVSGATALRRLTFDGVNRHPAWSADGSRVTFQSQRGNDRSLFWQRADGSGPAERLTQAEAGTAQMPQSWSPDGHYLLFDVVKAGTVSLWVYSARDRTTRLLVDEHSRVPTDAAFSPDGRWFIYTSQETSAANARVSVQPFPPTGAKYVVSEPGDDGHHPAWSRDGRFLFYSPGPGNRLQRVAITTGASFQYGQPVTIPRRFSNAPPANPRTYDVARDGRFVGLIESGAVKESGMPVSQITTSFSIGSKN